MASLEYTKYLNLDQLLNSQSLESKKNETPVHEEMLFIIAHQTYELWFKQIIWEVDSIIKIFDSSFVSDKDLSIAIHRLKRINEIWRLLIAQITVLETMSPLEFLEFRNFLYPASGFQSVQFRVLENKLGLSPTKRITHGGCPYHSFLTEEKAKEVIHLEKEKTLLSTVDSWLSRTPYLKTQGYDFWEEYKSAVKKMFGNEKKLIQNLDIHDDEKKRSIISIEKSQKSFDQIMDKEEFNKLKAAGEWTLSYEALQAALFIQLYRHELKLQSANRLIESLIDLDENMTQWRNRHAQMALRMLGKKMGTGGSSGEEYLKQSAENHKIFYDFFKLTTFFINEKSLSPIPTPKN